MPEAVVLDFSASPEEWQDQIDQLARYVRGGGLEPRPMTERQYLRGKIAGLILRDPFKTNSS